jgi:hypothetical protein
VIGMTRFPGRFCARRYPALYEAARGLLHPIGQQKLRCRMLPGGVESLSPRQGPAEPAHETPRIATRRRRTDWSEGAMGSGLGGTGG